jgi:hypothetical protein
MTLDDDDMFKFETQERTIGVANWAWSKTGEE